MSGRRAPVGAVLAGGLGRRIGGDKALVELAGRPLVRYPLLALSAVLDEVVIVAKADTALPEMPGVTIWLEPPEPRHPASGIAGALAFAAEGRAACVLAADMPFVPPALLAQLISTARNEDALAVLPVCEGRVQPFPGLYAPGAANPLARAARAGERLVEAVVALRPATIVWDEPAAFFSVNAPEDVLQAAAMLDLGDPHRSPPRPGLGPQPRAEPA